MSCCSQLFLNAKQAASADKAPGGDKLSGGAWDPHDFNRFCTTAGANLQVFCSPPLLQLSTKMAYCVPVLMMIPGDMHKLLHSSKEMHTLSASLISAVVCEVHQHLFESKTCQRADLGSEEHAAERSCQRGAFCCRAGHRLCEAAGESHSHHWG